MENTQMLLYAVLCGGTGLLLMIVLLKYLTGYRADMKYVNMEINRAADWKEYVYWHRERTILRWSLIPGLSPKRVRKIRRFFTRGKYESRKEKQNDDGLVSVILPPVIGICLCAACLAGGTFAWFSSSAELPAQSIQTANYNITAAVMAEAGELTASNGVYKLEKDTSYKVTLTAVGDASTGYCRIDLGGTDIHTVQFPSKGHTENTVSFTLEICQAVDMKLTAQWGSSTRAEEDKLANGGTYTYGKRTEEIITPPEETIEETTVPADTAVEEETTVPETTQEPIVHTVKEGDTLVKIAQWYGTTQQELAEYNDIENPSLIYVGQEILIPPKE